MKTDHSGLVSSSEKWQGVGLSSGGLEELPTLLPGPPGPYLLELREAQTGHEEKAELTVALLRAEPKAGEEEGQEG